MPKTDTRSFGRNTPYCCKNPDCVTCQVELCVQACRALHAIRLIKLGARVKLVCQVTGLERAVIKRLYRQLQGKPSPSGQTPFTDAWYLQDDFRMLQAAMVWHLHRYFLRAGRNQAQVLIDVYESYAEIVGHPLLDMTHAAFVPRLVTMEQWHERICSCCGTVFLEPLVGRRWTCPGCRLFSKYRCIRCGARLIRQRNGRRRRFCDRCRMRRRHQTSV